MLRILVAKIESVSPGMQCPTRSSVPCTGLPTSDAQSIHGFTRSFLLQREKLL